MGRGPFTGYLVLDTKQGSGGSPFFLCVNQNGINAEKKTHKNDMKKLAPEEAKARLQPHQAPSKSGKRNTKPLELKEVIGNAGNDLYIFGNDCGNILMPAYDAIRPILGMWEECGDMPPSMKMWLQNYANEIEWSERVGESIPAPTAAAFKAPAKPRQSVPMMLETKWTQKAPYNDMCVFDGKRCVTGCNTTAAAQVVFYWREYQCGCKGTDDYITSTNKYKVDALPPVAMFDYAHMVKTPKTAEEKRAVAELMAYLGRTMHSNYTPTSTGAYTHKLANHFNNAIRLCDNATAIWASKLGESGFDQRVYDDIAKGRPVIIGGDMITGGGHAFVADGYDADKDMYHINWGWGCYDGWFAMSALNATSKYAFNANKVAVVGIYPTRKPGDVNGDGETNIADVMQVIQAAQNGSNDPKADINYDGKVTITDAQLLIDRILGR